MVRIERNHAVELVEHREIIDQDSTCFDQFTFAVDGRLSKPWEIPRSHRWLYKTDEDFETYLARSAVTFAQSEWNR